MYRCVGSYKTVVDLLASRFPIDLLYWYKGTNTDAAAAGARAACLWQAATMLSTLCMVKQGTFLLFRPLASLPQAPLGSSSSSQRYMTQARSHTVA